MDTQSGSQIVRITFEWQSWDCLPSDVVGQHITVVDRLRCTVVHRLCNNISDPMGEYVYPCDKPSLDGFFDYCENTAMISEWEDDYSVDVDDGWAWGVSIEYNDKSAKKVVGTIEPPPYGGELHKKMTALVDADAEFKLFW